jgi:hypothetical protein
MKDVLETLANPFSLVYQRFIKILFNRLQRPVTFRGANPI